MSRSSLPTAVLVKVPGSTSNCGAGFDTLGLALQIYNRVTLRRVAPDAADGQRLAAGVAGGLAAGPGEAGVGRMPPAASAVPARPQDARGQAMVAATAEAFFAATGLAPFAFCFAIDGEVPPARGLGSSVTVIGGVLGGLNVLSGAGLSRHDLVALATALEGHPDNAAAGILGGFCVARCDAQTLAYVDTLRVTPGADVVFVAVSPQVEMLTKEARGVLPTTLPYFDAVRSINSATYVTAAFLLADYARLRGAVADFMHEPYRLPRIPGGAAAIRAGVAAGAYTGWLSGSGSTVLCVSPVSAAAVVAAAMAQAFAEAGLASEQRLLLADHEGLVVERVE